MNFKRFYFYFFLVITFTIVCLFPLGLIAQEIDSAEYYSYNYKFSENFFTYHIPLWKKVLGFLKGKENINYLEIGVYEGGAALWVAENILTHPSSRMTCIDVILQDNLLHNLKISKFLEKTDLIIGKSQNELRKLESDSFDIIYIDGSSSSDDVLTDAVFSWVLLKTNGIMIFDNGDIDQPEELMPTLAVDSFIKIFSDYISVLYYGKQVVLQKNKLISFNNKKFNFVFDIAADWKKAKESIVSEHEKSVLFVNIAELSLIEVSEYAPLGEIKDLKKEALKEFDNKSKNMFAETGIKSQIISSQYKKIEGLDLYQINYSGAINVYVYKGQAYFSDIYIIKNSRIYILSFCAIKNDYFTSLGKDVFEGIVLSSFKIKSNEVNKF